MRAVGDRRDRDQRLREPGEIVRTRVLELLEHRWDRTVTTVVAGAGFGKSTAVAQAMRANQLAPRGVEGRISCRWGCEDAVRLVASATAALEGEAPARGSPLDRLQAVVAAHAPLPVCVVIDDIETIPATGTVLLGTLLDALPTNLHLVLVGRQLPGIGLARLRAAGELLEVGVDDLRFDEQETASLATALGAPAPAEHLGGWPAIIRLSLAAPDRSADDFLWEEVIRGLDEHDRAALQALCALGTASLNEIEQVTRRQVDVDAFCARVPLVAREGSHLVAHDLWHPFLADLGPPGSVDTLRKRVMTVVAARDDIVTSGQVAIRLGDHDALCEAAFELVVRTLARLPADIAADWLDAAPSLTDRPEMRLLRAALRNSRSSVEPPDDELDAIVSAFHDQGDARHEAGALALCTVAADSRRDLARLVTLSARAAAVASDRSEPILELLVDAVGAVEAMLAGDIGGALARLDRPRPDLPAGVRPEAPIRLHWRLLLLAGRADDAAAVVAAAAPHAEIGADRPLEAVARWLAGDPSGLDPATVELGPRRYEGLTERDRFDQAAFVAVIAASAPDRSAVDLAVGILDGSPVAAPIGPDGALLAVGRAAQRCVHHDDEGARHEIERFLARADRDPLTDAHLRRSLAIPYVCSSALRDEWDECDLGPSQRLARSIARTLVDAREGRLAELGPVPLHAVVTALPLPWAVELACRAAAAGRPWGTALAIDLADRFGDGVAAEVDWQADHGDAEIRRGAASVRIELPVAPPHRLSIAVLGPLTIHRDRDEVEASELRRVRVRELLTLLVVERSVARDRAIELLWPDQDLTKGRANLRVTLSHLLTAIEPARERGGPTYYVRATSTHLALTTSPSLVVDLWEVERLLAEAEAAREAGDAAARTARLAAAVDQWRGRALPDLDGVAELGPAALHVERRLADATLELGELELVGGSPVRASARAERVLTADVYDERAHRLAIAARLHVGGRTGAAEAIDRLHRALDELGADADETTQVLLRQAERMRSSPVGSIGR